MPASSDRTALFELNPLDRLGPSRFTPLGVVPERQAVRGRQKRQFKEGVQEQAPRNAGVYAMLDRTGRVIYVGKAKSLRVRLLSYFRGQDRKAGRILRHTRTLLWEHATDEFSALLRELELIQKFRPRFNVVGQPGRRAYFFLALGKTPAAQGYVTRSPSKNDLGIYGPFVGRRRADAAVRRLNDWFKLRDCPSAVPMIFSDQQGLFDGVVGGPKCLRYDFGTCTAPCAALCTRRSYGANVRAAKAFLEGRERGLIAKLTDAMNAASANLDYERAAALRDKLDDLKWLDDRLALLRRARDQRSYLYPMTGSGGAVTWYVIDRGQVRAAARHPECETDRSDIEKQFRDAVRFGPAVSDLIVDSVLLVAAWFRKFPDERAKLIPFDAYGRTSTDLKLPTRGDGVR